PMRRHARPAAPALSLRPLAGAASAQPADPAELLPAQTLAYVEVSNPAKLSQEVAALLRGSALENMPAAMARVRAKFPDNNQFPFWVGQELGMLSMFLSPEMVSE